MIAYCYLRAKLVLTVFAGWAMCNTAPYQLSSIMYNEKDPDGYIHTKNANLDNIVLRRGYGYQISISGTEPDADNSESMILVVPAIFAQAFENEYKPAADFQFYEIFRNFGAFLLRCKDRTYPQYRTTTDRFNRVINFYDICTAPENGGLDPPPSKSFGTYQLYRLRRGMPVVPFGFRIFFIFDRKDPSAILNTRAKSETSALGLPQSHRLASEEPESRRKLTTKRKIREPYSTHINPELSFLPPPSRAMSLSEQLELIRQKKQRNENQ